MIILLAVLSMGLAVESAQCEPSPTMRWLMGENVTLMDFGLYRLQEGLQSNKTIEGSGFIIAVGYDWDTNRINIGSHKLDYGASEVDTSQSHLRSMCLDQIARLKIALAVIPTTGEGVALGHSRLRMSYFSHEGFRAKDTPANIAEHLDQITDLFVRIEGHVEARCGLMTSEKEVFFKGL